MSLVARLLSAIDDRLNPIVVKEVRQAVHGRFLAGLLLFFLVFQLATLGLFLLMNGISTIDLVGGTSYGEEVFGILAGILFFATVFCIPVYAAVRIYAERSGENLALYFISTLSPRRIVAGKLASNLVLTLLLFSACLPYLSFTYFLRGIDLPTVGVALAAGLSVSALGIQSAIFLASLEVTRLLRVLVGLVGLGWLMALFSIVLSFAIALPQQGVGSRLGSWQLWGPMALVLTAGGLFFGLLFVLSVAVFTHGAANRARPVRIYAFGAWLAATLGTAYACFVHDQKDVVQVWLFLAFVGFGLSFLPAICARDRSSLRVAGEVPRAPLRRLAAFFTFSGSANGVAFSVLMIALTAAAAEIFDRRLLGGLEETPAQFLGFSAYCFSYALLALAVQRGGISRRIGRRHTWVVALVLAAFLSLAPPIAGLLVAPDAIAQSLDFGWWMVANPFSPFQHRFGDVAIRFALAWAAVMALGAGPWFLRQVRAFRPPASAAAEIPAVVPLREPQAEG